MVEPDEMTECLVIDDIRMRHCTDPSRARYGQSIGNDNHDKVLYSLVGVDHIARMLQPTKEMGVDSRAIDRRKTYWVKYKID